MSKRKVQPQRVRPDVYTQALNAAKKRIEKALEERSECETQLARLNEEIPRLQRMIDVFQPESASPTFPQEYKKTPILDAVAKQARLVPKPSPEALKLVPEHLRHFVQPQSEEQIPVNGSVEDQFLPDVE